MPMETAVMVGEKPKVAGRIADALGNYTVEKNRGVKNYVIETDEREIIIAPAVGHIFNLEQSEGGWEYPVFDVEWRPIFETEDDANYVKKYYNNLKDQIEKADTFINACDFDLEGCLHPEEKVVVKKDGEILSMKVKRLVDSFIENQKEGERDGFEYSEPELEILGMDDWKSEFQEVEKVMRRPSDKTYLEIKAFNGRKVKVSSNHPLLLATENGLEDRKAENIREGDRILATKELPGSQKKEEIDLVDLLDEIYVHGFKEEMAIMPAEMKNYVDKSRKQCLNYRHNDRMPKEVFLELEEHLDVERDDLTVSSYKGSTRLPAKLELNYELGRFLGLYLAEGCIDSGGFIGLYFGSEEEKLVEEVQSFLRDTVKTEGKLRKRKTEGSYGDSKCFEVGTKSKILRKVLKEIEIGKDSGSKKMPEWILSTPNNFKKGILSGYWDGDGSLFIDSKDERAVASAGSKSHELLEDIFYLLQTQGINASFQAWNYSNREMHNLTIGRSEDIRKLSNLVSLDSEIKAQLEETLSNSRYTPMSAVPTCLAQRQEVKPEKKGQIKAADTLDTTHVAEWEDEMENYPEGDVTFLKVKKVEEKETEAEYFYDFQTESRNYQHGNGVISHNSVIGYNVIKHLADPEKERIKRMKFSTLTPGDLQDAFDDLETFDEGMTQAGLTRHVLDFYYGINVSRALMQAVRKNDRYHTLSTGRVQGPTLKILADKERAIQEFEPDPYWEIYLNHSEFRAQWFDDEDRIWEEDFANEVFHDIRDEDTALVANIKENNYKHNPPVPFNLTGLQSEASSQFGISPKQTQQIAQELYENGLISYPRTESQKLPAKLGYENLLTSLRDQDDYEELAKKVLKKDKIYPRQGKKKDDAHPAIYPTGEEPSGLNKQQGKIYDLIVKRFFAVFGDAAKRRTLTMTLKVKEETFTAKSKVTLERNWFDLYDPYVKVDEAELPDLSEGEILDVEGFDLEEKETQPPRRYSQSTVVSELEKRNLGTKATRAQTVDRLYSRDFIEEDPIKVTDLGLAVTETLEKHTPDLLSEELTRRFEEKMESIREGNETSGEVIEEAREELDEMLTAFKNQEKEIGAELVETIDAERERKRQLGPCDQCEDGTLRIVKTDNGRFVGCSNYPDCENSYPLPRNGSINATNEVCSECNTPKIWVNRKKGKNYSMCIDPDCPTKDDW